VGINEHAASVAFKLNLKHTDLHNVIGLIGITNKEVGNVINGLTVLGSIENINKVIHDKKINEVIFSSEELSYNQMIAIVVKSQNENVEFKLIGNNLDFLVGKTSVSILDDTPIIELNYNISNPLKKVIKRLFDFSLSLIVLFFIYPFIYLMVHLKKKQTEFQEFVLKTPKVMSGKFSFVGPEGNENFNELYIGKKGITGLWYIENSKGKDSEKLDLFYAKNQNIWLDLEILGKALNKMWSTRK
jgi:hypothetical protein